MYYKKAFDIAKQHIEVYSEQTEIHKMDKSSLLENMRYYFRSDPVEQSRVAYVSELMASIVALIRLVKKDDITTTEIFDICMGIQKQKAKDYQNVNSDVRHIDHYRYGVESIEEFMYTKSMRIRSLIQSNDNPNFESIEDSCYDLLNYCSFYIAHELGILAGQDEETI